MSANESQIGGTHYTDMDVQPWDAMKAWMSPEAFAGFLLGNVIKYAARHQAKGGIEDLEKAAHYLAKLIEVRRAPSFATILDTSIRDALLDKYKDGLPPGQAVPHKFGPGDPGWVTHVRMNESLDDAAKRATDEAQQAINCGVSDWPGPDWSQAPDNATAWTMDEDGQADWHIGNTLAYPGNAVWHIRTSRTRKAPSFDYTGHWRDSLRKRPEEVK